MIYTTGYSGKNIDNLKPLLERLDARLVDIRFTPGESPLKWSKNYLKILGEENYNVMLMCECAEYEKCHRQIIAQELEKAGKESQEIRNWGV